jgi:hypothetical protein
MIKKLDTDQHLRYNVINGEFFVDSLNEILVFLKN